MCMIPLDVKVGSIYTSVEQRQSKCAVREHSGRGHHTKSMLYL